MVPPSSQKEQLQRTVVETKKPYPTTEIGEGENTTGTERREIQRRTSVTVLDRPFVEEKVRSVSTFTGLSRTSRFRRVKQAPEKVGSPLKESSRPRLSIRKTDTKPQTLRLQVKYLDMSLTRETNLKIIQRLITYTKDSIFL